LRDCTSEAVETCRTSARSCGTRSNGAPRRWRGPCGMETRHTMALNQPSRAGAHHE
jgi:hypothetical protein